LTIVANGHEVSTLDRVERTKGKIEGRVWGWGNLNAVLTALDRRRLFIRADWPARKIHPMSVSQGQGSSAPEDRG
jgi:hypothetical protein